MNQGFFSVVKNFLSAESCKEIIKNLPLHSDNINEIPQKDTGMGMWYRTTPGSSGSGLRIPVYVDYDLESRIRKEYIGEEFINTNKKMYITKYNQGEHLNIHIDPLDKTAIILLNNEFTGGDFIVGRWNVEMDIGDLLIFNKGLPHQVSEITSGTRYALTLWFKKES